MKLFRVLAVTLLFTFVATTAFAADWQVGTDDPFSDFATLGDAFAFLGSEPGTHNIAIDAGIYTDVGLACPTNIDAITGGEDVDFMGSSGIFMTIDGCAVAISGLNVDGYDQGFNGNAIGGSITGCHFTNISLYGVALGVTSSGVTVEDNCFNNCGSPGGYDSSAGANTWGGNYWDDATVPAYALAGGGANFDNAAVITAQAVTPSGTYNRGDTVEVEIMWEVPDCDVGSVLAGYELTIHANAAKLELLSAAFDKEYLGVDDGTEGSALYIGPTEGIEGSGDVTFVAVNFSNPGIEKIGHLATLTYEVIAANTTVWVQVNSTFYNASSVVYVVSSPNNVLTLMDNVDPVLEYYTAHDPIGNATFSPTYPLNVQVGATDDYDLAKIQYSLDGGAWTDWQSISGELYDSPAAPGGLSVGLGADGDVRLLELRAVDGGGNTSNVMEYTYTTDLSGPSFSVVISDLDGCGNQAGFTNDSVVNVALTTADTDVDLIEVYTTDKGWQAAEDFGAWDATEALNQAEGPISCAIRLTDLYGNVAPVIWSNTLTLDMTAPTPSADFRLSHTSPVGAVPGPAKTSTKSIFGEIDTFGADAAFYKVHKNAGQLDCDDGGWLPAVHDFPVTLTGSDGMKTMRFRTMDNAGNQSPIQTDQIELDMTAPTISLLEMAECSNHHAANSITVTFPDDDVVIIGVQDNGGGYKWFGDWFTPMVSPYTLSYNMTTAPLNGTDAAIDVQLRDNSQPISNQTTASGSIHFDHGAGVPSLTSIIAKDKTSGDLTFSNEDQFAVDIVVPSGSEDIVSVEFSHDGVTWQAPRAKDFSGGGTITMWYTPTTPIPQAYNAVWVRGSDCAGNVSNVVNDVPGIIIDTVTPIITAVEIDGGAALSNDTSLTVVLTVTETWPGGGNQSGVELSLTSDFAVVQSFAWASFYEFEVAPGDATHCIFARMTDRAGNASNENMFDCIEVDMTTPTGSFNIVSNNAASPGYSNTRWIHFEDIDVDADVVDIAFKHMGATGGELPILPNSTGWISLSSLGDPSMYAPGGIRVGSGAGVKEVTMLLRDDAGNTNAWTEIVDDIVFNPAAPAAPSAGLSVTPIESAFLNWDDDPDVAEWHIRYSFTGDYPLYGAGVLGVLYPVAPTDVTGFPAGPDLVTSVSQYDFVEGPGPDVYTFTLWALGLNGLMSAPVSITGTNYIMGDFSDKAAVLDYDGCLDFEDEFFLGLGLSYGTSSPDVNFNDEVDYTQTFGSDPAGLPDPDGLININDLVLFAFNYRNFNCDNFFDPYAKAMSSGPVAMGVEIPRNVQAGSEITVVFTADNVASIFAYHAVFDYNADVLEVVSMDAGAMYDGVANPFFDGKIKDNKLDVGSVIIGEGSFEGDEMFTVTFKARISGPVVIEEVKIECVDAENIPIDVEFTANKTIGELPTDFALAQNYPNPFNPSTTIEFSLPIASDYRLTIYNITGQVVTSFVGKADAGMQSVVWNATNNASGIYFYKLEADTYSAIRKMVLLK